MSRYAGTRMAPPPMPNTPARNPDSERPDRDQQQGEFDELLGIEAGHHVFGHPKFSTCDPRICMATRKA